MSEGMYKPDPHDITVCRVPNGTMQRTVVAAANRYNREGEEPLIICGVRHHDEIMNSVLDAIGMKGFTTEQGFVDQWGNYMDREEAAYVATYSGQRMRNTRFDRKYLFSEDCW